MKHLQKIGKVVGSSLIGVCLILALTQLFLLRGTPGQKLKSNTYQSNLNYSRVPTLLIPGWGGNTITYNKLIQTYQQQNIAQKIMTVWVSPTNRIRIRGNWHGQKNALIQILFDWNYSPTYHPQVNQLRHVLTYLYQVEGIKKINVVAHSYGGTEFIHAYLGSQWLQAHLRLHKLVFLGVPVEESLPDRLRYHYLLIHHSTDKNFQQLQSEMQKWQLNYSINIYNLMGSKEGSKITDGAVPHIQSEMIQALIRSHPMIRYHQKTYQNTTHSQLHNRQIILQKIEQLLWGKE
ncbi:alpha/beta hydrolase [Limosilactobacillus sp.]|uniref:alpha/beta hydrolase n=1 Tax=Limosilactobacillus sp. TaxID=2773925 RepID=UPI0035A13154